ncbi:MAG: cupin domain-containing protein [Chloroflexota bacterium]|nr:cupin domain-containing protein [Chloroflexota bacterium]
MSRRHLVLRADDVEPFPAGDGIGYLSQHVLGEEVTGLHDMLLNRGTLAPQQALHGEAHPDNDEVYYIVSGQAWLDLGGDARTGAGSTSYRVAPGVVAFIPAGTFHRLRNDGDVDLVLLTIWPQPVAPNGNGLHARRVRTWGSAFKLREGRTLVAATDGDYVAEPGGWSPIPAS